MALLTHDEILNRRKSDLIPGKPFSEGQVGPASVDLHLGRTFRPLKKTQKIYHVRADTSCDWGETTELIELKAGEFFLLMPGETCLAITEEEIRLPSNISGWLTGRSCFTRVGLMVYTSFVHPGSRGKQVLEISNHGARPLALHPGVPICQLVLSECNGHATYQGRFQNQRNP